MARTVNTTQVIANWLIGREIIEEEQKGKARAGYGEQVTLDLASRLHEEYGPGYGLVNLKLFKQFYRLYPELAGLQKGYAVRSLLLADAQTGTGKKGYAARSQFAGNISDATRRKSGKRPAEAGPLHHTPCGESSLALSVPGILHAPRGGSWEPGQLHPNLS